MTVRVCDAIMGAGKTNSAITQMNEDVDSRYIFITPYLDEVERIKKSCAERNFKDPKNSGKGKLDGLHQLLINKHNIASTHALFSAYTEETITLIQSGGYKLILDEVFDVIEKIDVHKDDIQMLIDENIIGVLPDDRVIWISETYDGKFSDDLKGMVTTGHVMLYGGHLMLWTFPVEIFKAFEEVTVLTYMFDAQIQKYYFDMNDIEIKRIGSRYVNGVYRFCDYEYTPEYVRDLINKIHIVEDDKLNAIGNSHSALSVSWYERAKEAKNRPMITVLKNNLINVFRNKFKSSSNQNLWTTFKAYQSLIRGKGYTKGFLSYNIRATNEYRDRDHLAYCVNVYYNPYMKNYFVDHGIEVKEDEYALSEMIQWIWRSAIRDGKDIWIYIPSKRMRDLLKDWLFSQSLQKVGAA